MRSRPRLRPELLSTIRIPFQRLSLGTHTEG